MFSWDFVRLLVHRLLGLGSGDNFCTELGRILFISAWTQNSVGCQNSLSRIPSLLLWLDCWRLTWPRAASGMDSETQSHSSAAPSGPQMLDFLGVHLSYTNKKPEGDVQSWWYLKITKEECYCGYFIQTTYCLILQLHGQIDLLWSLVSWEHEFSKNFCKSSVTYDAPSKIILHKLLGYTKYHGSFICISVTSPKEIVRKELLTVNLTICKSYMTRWTAPDCLFFLRSCYFLGELMTQKTCGEPLSWGAVVCIVQKCVQNPFLWL